MPEGEKKPWLGDRVVALHEPAWRSRSSSRSLAYCFASLRGFTEDDPPQHRRGSSGFRSFFLPSSMLTTLLMKDMWRVFMYHGAGYRRPVFLAGDRARS